MANQGNSNGQRNIVKSLTGYATLPAISLEKQIMASKTKLITMNGELITEVTIPLVYDVMFEEFALYAVPINHSIIITTKSNIIVDQTNSRFFYCDKNTKQTYLSKDLTMMENTPLSDAVTTKDCTLTSLKNPYDVWILMHAHNTMLFY